MDKQCNHAGCYLVCEKPKSQLNAMSLGRAQMIIDGMTGLPRNAWNRMDVAAELAHTLMQAIETVRKYGKS